jgi:hypothetical protein
MSSRSQELSEALRRVQDLLIENAGLRTTKSARRVDELERELQDTRHSLGLCRQSAKNADAEIRKLDARIDELGNGLAAIDDVLGNGADEQLWPPGLTRAEAVGRMVQDVADAAGELRVPIPEPGTDAAKMLTANAILRRRGYKLHNRLADQRIIVDGWIEATGATDPVTYKAARRRVGSDG